MASKTLKFSSAYSLNRRSSAKADTKITSRVKILTDEDVLASDYVITMGCGDKCPFYPGKTYLDWKLADPAGQGVDFVRPIRDEIRGMVEGLISQIDANFGN